MTMNMKDVFEKVVRDVRREQDDQWGGPEHDDRQTPTDWSIYIKDQLDKFEDAHAEDDDQEVLYRLENIGALAMAAWESTQRKMKSEKVD